MYIFVFSEPPQTLIFIKNIKNYELMYFTNIDSAWFNAEYVTILLYFVGNSFTNSIIKNIKN